MDDAVDRGSADAVFLGEIGQGHFAVGVIRLRHGFGGPERRAAQLPDLRESGRLVAIVVIETLTC